MTLPTPEELFFEKIGEETDSGCQLWTGPVDKDGYGLFYVGKERHYAHRARYLIKFGSIPLFHNVLHTCENRLCVNLEHLIVAHHRAPKKKSKV